MTTTTPEAKARPCDCQKRLETALLECFQKSEPTARNHRAVILGYGINFTTGGMSQAAQVEYDALYPLKKGGERYKATKGHIVFNHCPFCGVKLQ